MDMQARLSGNLRAALASAVEARVQAIDAAVQKAGLDCEAQAKQNAPVDTGFLKNSIHYERTGTARCTVEVGAHYGLFVELGHLTRDHMSRVPARPFLFPAYTTTARALREALERIMK